jgi:hypothetical protein
MTMDKKRHRDSRREVHHHAVGHYNFLTQKKKIPKLKPKHNHEKKRNFYFYFKKKN